MQSPGTRKPCIEVRRRRLPEMDIGDNNGPITILVETYSYHFDDSIIDFNDLDLSRSPPVSFLHSSIRIALDIPSAVTFRSRLLPFLPPKRNVLGPQLSDQVGQPNQKDMLKVDIDIMEDSLGVEWLVRRADW